jgi:hypothetical protein
LLAEAYDCFMVGTYMVQPNTSVVRGQWQAPLGSSPGKPPDPERFAAVLALVKDKAFGGAEEAPSLTPRCARRRRENEVGAEECSRRGSNKRMNKQGAKKWYSPPLTKKAPYKPYALIGLVRACAVLRLVSALKSAVCDDGRGKA